jgi:sigma-B regulation protein RsbU (phosphoserine phosphatase)
MVFWIPGPVNFLMRAQVMNRPYYWIHRAKCMALGLWENIALDEYSLFLPKGSLLVMFTDGMTDCRNPKGEPFGLERIKYTMADQRTVTAQLSCDQLFDNLMIYQNGSKQDDDVTLVAVHAK